MIITGTGSRQFEIYGHQAWVADSIQLYLERRLHESGRDVRVISGGAQGFDYLLTLAAARAKIPYDLCLPNERYGDYYWYGKGSLNRNTGLSRLRWEGMIRNAKEIIYVDKLLGIRGLYQNGQHINFHRNEVMIDMCDRIVTMPIKGISRGTQHALDYAQIVNKPVDRLEQYGDEEHGWRPQ